MEFNVFEDVISKLDGVLNVKIVSENEVMQELHILASDRRAPKQIVRDIESALLAAFGYRIDRKVISVAQIHTDEYEAIKRIKYEGINFNLEGNMIECNVKLLYENEEHSVIQQTLNTATNRKRIVAQATLKSVEKILGQSSIFDVQDVLINTSRDITFVSVIVTMIINGREENMVGAAIVKNDSNEAISKAALDAINRKIEKNDL